MIAVLQRVSRAEVRIAGQLVGKIGTGYTILLGVMHDDTERDCDWLVQKIPELRLFNDEHGKMNRSLLEIGGGILVISQFTLAADYKKGRRPSFTRAAEPEKAEALYERFIDGLRQRGVPVSSGQFGAMMEVELINDGPVTLVLDSCVKFPR